MRTMDGPWPTALRFPNQSYLDQLSEISVLLSPEDDGNFTESNMGPLGKIQSNIYVTRTPGE